MKKSEVLYQKDKTNNINKLVTFTVILFICFLSIGYSAFSNTLSIEGILATVRPNASARITNVSISTSTNGGFSNSEQFTQDTVLASASLPNANSTVTYKIDVTVFLATEMKITSITGNDPNLEYTISGYNIGDILCDSHNECNLGATIPIYVTVGYANGVNNTGTATHPFEVHLTFATVNLVAKIGNTRYETLQEAVNDVPTNGTETTVHLLKNTSEEITVLSGQNITFNMHGNTITNTDLNGETLSIFENSGTIRISDGTFNGAAGRATFNNTGGTMYISGGTINATGSKQAINNSGGTVYISGGTLKNTSTNRACVQNLANSTLVITGGSLESTRFAGVVNAGTMTIGNKDGNASGSSPAIKGQTYGIDSSTNYNYYDGVIKGVTAALSNENKVTDKETGLDIVHSGETISSKLFDVVRLGSGYLVTFNANGGNASFSTKLVEQNKTIGALPSATQANYIFDGWYNDPTNGTKYTTSTVITSTTTLYAHWTDPQASAVAKIGDVYYLTVADAISAVSANGVEVTIEIRKDTQERVTIPSGKNIKMNIGSHTMSNDGNSPVFENSGTLTIYNGTITTNEKQGAINNKSSGTLYITGGTISATGLRQTLYNDGGTAYISGGTFTSSSNERACVQNLNNGKLCITGGTITSTGYSGVLSSGGTLEIGTKDGNIDTSTPVIRGVRYGVERTGGSFKFYDGIIKGITDAKYGAIADSDGTYTTGSELIGSDTYITGYMQ